MNTAAISKKDLEANGHVEDTPSESEGSSSEQLNPYRKRSRRMEYLYISIAVVLGAALIAVLVYFSVINALKDDPETVSSHHAMSTTPEPDESNYDYVFSPGDDSSDNTQDMGNAGQNTRNAVPRNIGMTRTANEGSPIMTGSAGNGAGNEGDELEDAVQPDTPMGNDAVRARSLMPVSGQTQGFQPMLRSATTTTTTTTAEPPSGFQPMLRSPNMRRRILLPGPMPDAGESTESSGPGSDGDAAVSGGIGNEKSVSGKASSDSAADENSVGQTPSSDSAENEPAARDNTMSTRMLRNARMGINAESETEANGDEDDAVAGDAEAGEKSDNGAGNAVI